MRALHWFRADLRLADNTALAAAAARAARRDGAVERALARFEEARRAALA